jgi:hypothetical protein
MQRLQANSQQPERLNGEMRRPTNTESKVVTHMRQNTKPTANRIIPLMIMKHLQRRAYSAPHRPISPIVFQ